MDFLNSFALFGMGAVALVIAVVEGVKAVADQIKRPLSPIACVVTAVVVSWVILGMIALDTYMPASEPYVRFTLAGILLPLGAMGLFSGAKNAAGGIVGMVKSGSNTNNG